MIIMKFGGSSLATAAGIRQVADLITNTESTPCVVLSAMGNTTTMLFEVATAADAGDSKAALAIIGKAASGRAWETRDHAGLLHGIVGKDGSK